jgi:hypothetical protein
VRPIVARDVCRSAPHGHLAVMRRSVCSLALYCSRPRSPLPRS